MTSESCRETVEVEQTEYTEEDRVVKSDGVLRSILRGLFWPFSLVVRAFRWFWGEHGFIKPQESFSPSRGASSPARPSLTARKRVHWVTRLLVNILPRWVYGDTGYPPFSSIGRSLSPETSVSPTKLHGKGTKRKQDDLEEDDEEHPTWVEVLSQELADDDDPEEDPDYEPSAVETDSDEYASHNSTETDLQTSQGQVVIEDVNTAAEKPSCPDV